MSDAAAKTRFWRIDLLAVGVCLLLSAALYLTMIHPLARKQARHVTQSAELAAVQVQASDRAASLGRLQTELAETRTALDATPMRLQPASVINQRLAALTDLANEQAITLDQVQPGQKVAATRYDVVPIQLVGSGTYASVQTFLNKLHGQFGDTGVRSFRLTARERGDDVVGAFVIDLVWYTAPAPRTP